MKKPTKKSVLNKKSIAVYSIITSEKRLFLSFQQLYLAEELSKIIQSNYRLKYKEKSTINSKGHEEYKFHYTELCL